MPNEELTQRGYFTSDGLRGDPFGIYESFNIGATNLAKLVEAGLQASLPSEVSFPFKAYKPPRRVGNAKPDQLVARRSAGGIQPVAVMEHKGPGELSTKKKELAAAEQAIFYGLALDIPVAGFTADGWGVRYVDVGASRDAGKPVLLDDRRPFNAGVLTNLIQGNTDMAKDPTALAETVWQIIWHATKSEPIDCLLTFVELFVLKFLSDNLRREDLPEVYRFYGLLGDERDFRARYGRSQIEYYVGEIRPRIKTLFPDNTVAADPGVAALFGLQTVVSKTSVINGFAFLRSSEDTLTSYNATFIRILEAFNEFGPLTAIDPEFKLRLYETFLRRSARQQRLGQFFTPRNVVRPMVRMAQLGKLGDGGVVLDPAAGVGGFVLEPLLFEDALPDNYTFSAGSVTRRVRSIGIDVDPNLHILAKANMLLHLAEDVRAPGTTRDALNKAMANTFVLMNEHQMLGSLLNPPREAADVILTNPPYVTQGSAIYRQAVEDVSGPRNGVTLSGYYDAGGLGLESYFLRYISGALKKGGRAFVIVPLGMLNRSEPRMKRSLLKECSLVASIALPRKAFFNTAQPTYILVVERRYTDEDPRSEVFCAVARSTGETLDQHRTPTPDDNDLADIAEAFVAWSEGDREPADKSGIIKLRSASAFAPDERWDVTRFWSDDELVELGMRTPPVARAEFLAEVEETLTGLLAEAREARVRLAHLESDTTKSVSIGDEKLFEVVPGKRVTTAEVRENPGNLAVYTCTTKADAEKGRIEESFWADVKGYPVFEGPLVTVNATGASAVGIVFVREGRFAMTDDVIGVRTLTQNIDMAYLASAVRTAIAGGDFQYEAKLYQGRVKQLIVEIPVNDDGEFDLDRQQAIGQASRDIAAIQERLEELGSWSGDVRLS